MAENRKSIRNLKLRLILALTFGLFGLVALSASEAVKISKAQQETEGVLLHSVSSPYQNRETAIRVLLPDRMEQGERYPVVYVLPVEPGNETRWGNGLVEAMKHDLHNKHQVIFVAPTFSQLPWYADHSTNPVVCQETYFTEIVVPFVERTYAASQKSEDRLLLGFSKSGWGAWSLLLRHPQKFGRAAAWDAPLMMDRLGKYGTTGIFGTQENFEKYRLVDLLRKKTEFSRNEKRLILTGYGNFGEHHHQMHSLLNKLRISHDYRDGPQRKHDWHSGWMAEAVELLFGPEAIEAKP